MAYVKPKPKLRIDHIDNIKTTIARLFDKKSTDFPYQNCLNCKHWAYGKDMCGKFNAKPPTEVLIYSCEAYEDDFDIPF